MSEHEPSCLTVLNILLLLLILLFQFSSSLLLCSANYCVALPVPTRRLGQGAMLKLLSTI